MKVLSLRHQGYRNLEPDTFFPGEGVNLICGPNAQGKTNLLEALWLFTGGRSFRGTRDSELVRRGEEQAKLTLSFYRDDREQEAQLTLSGGKRHASLNGVPLHSPGQLVGRICAVIFSPEHISLVREGPAGRRAFLDGALCQIRPGYVRLLNRYRRTLSQRNALLKDIPRHCELEDTLAIWDEKLVQDGAKIVAQRTAYLDLLRGIAAERYSGLSHGRETLSLTYRESAPDLRASLRAGRRRDIQQGFTGAGPHRDDFSMEINSENARAFGSQGQKRSIVLALKLAEAAILEERTGEKPLVLLDDVLSELDATRQEYLLNHLTDCQVFITCCEPGQAAQLRGGRLFSVQAGRVTASPAIP